MNTERFLLVQKIGSRYNVNVCQYVLDGTLYVWETCFRAHCRAEANRKAAQFAEWRNLEIRVDNETVVS